MYPNFFSSVVFTFEFTFKSFKVLGGVSIFIETSNSILVMWFILLPTPPSLNWSTLNNVNYCHHFLYAQNTPSRAFRFCSSTSNTICNNVMKKNSAYERNNELNSKFQCLKTIKYLRLWKSGRKQGWHHATSHLYLQCCKWQSHFTCTWDYAFVSEQPLVTSKHGLTLFINLGYWQIEWLFYMDMQGTLHPIFLGGKMVKFHQLKNLWLA